MKIPNTVATIFMVPTLKIPREKLTDPVIGFLNGYVRDLSREEEYKDSVSLLFHPLDMAVFRDFLEGEQERTHDILDDYDLGEGLVVVVYRLNPTYKRDFELVRKGRYSKTSPSFQGLFAREVEISQGGVGLKTQSLQWRIFQKTQDMVDYWEKKLEVTLTGDFEVWGCPVQETETLDIQRVREQLLKLEETTKT